MGARLACGLWSVVGVFDGGVIGDAALGFFLVVLSFGWLIAWVSWFGLWAGCWAFRPFSWVSGWLAGLCFWLAGGGLLWVVHLLRILAVCGVGII